MFICSYPHRCQIAHSVLCAQVRAPAGGQAAVAQHLPCNYATAAWQQQQQSLPTCCGMPWQTAGASCRLVFEIGCASSAALVNCGRQQCIATCSLPSLACAGVRTACHQQQQARWRPPRHQPPATIPGTRSVLQAMPSVGHWAVRVGIKAERSNAAIRPIRRRKLCSWTVAWGASPCFGLWTGESSLQGRCWALWSSAALTPQALKPKQLQPIWWAGCSGCGRGLQTSAACTLWIACRSPTTASWWLRTHPAWCSCAGAQWWHGPC
jgi:hypothetical protein